MRDPFTDFIDFDAQALVDTLAGHLVYQHVVSIRGWTSVPAVQGGFTKEAGHKNSRKAKYLTWLDQTSRAMAYMAKPRQPLVYAVRLFFILAFGPKSAMPKQSDWDNHTKAVQDAVVRAGILAGDNLPLVGGSDGVWVVRAKEDLVWVGIR